MYKILLFLICVVLGGCATLKEMTPEEKAFMEKARQMPMSFSLPKSETDPWGRAQSFVHKYSSMKLQTATDFVIDTYNPTASSMGASLQYAYTVSRAPIGDIYEYTVECRARGNEWGLSLNQISERCRENAHILAYYMKTGEIMPSCIYMGS